MGVLPPKNQAFEAWNSFLRENQGEKFQDRQIEISLLSKIVSKLLGESDAPLLFPVFIKAVQDYSKNRDLPTDHITPELMEQFYNQVSVSLADSRI